jgi:hypothetical protein
MDDKQKIKNFDGLMKDFDAYVAPIARQMGWHTHYSDVNWVPPNSENPDHEGHNPFQVLICLATQSKNWEEVCSKTGNCSVSIFGKMTNL